MSSSTEAVTASIQYIFENTTELSFKAKAGDDTSKSIQTRAAEIKNKGMNAIQVSKNVYKEKNPAY